MVDNEYLRTVVDGLVCDMDNVKSSLAELYRRTEEKDPSIENLEIDVNNNRTLSYRLESEIIHNTEKLDMLLNQAKFINDAERKYSSNFLAAIISVIAALAVSIIYIIVNGVQINLVVGIQIVVLMYLSFLTFTIGYDKVIQMIKQISVAKSDKEE